MCIWRDHISQIKDNAKTVKEIEKNVVIQMFNKILNKYHHICFPYIVRLTFAALLFPRVYLVLFVVCLFFFSWFFGSFRQIQNVSEFVECIRIRMTSVMRSQTRNSSTKFLRFIKNKRFVFGVFGD